MEFVYQCIDYLKANPTLAIVLLAVLALLLIVIVVIIASSASRKKKKRLAKKAITVEKTAEKIVKKTAEEKAEEERAKKEKAEAERQATLARLEAEEKLAEQEEAELRAKETAKTAPVAEAKKAETKETAKSAKQTQSAETKPAETKSAEKKVTEKKSTAQKATAQKNNEQKATAERKLSTSEEIAKAVAERSEKEHAQKIKREKEAEEKAREKKKIAVQKALGDDESEAEKAGRYSGKWTICRVVADGESEEEETYFFELHASNGEKLLSSEEYTSYAGALRGIATHKANIEKGNFKITLSKKGDYIFKLLSGKNMLLCMGENYPTRARCENAIESTKRFAKTAVIDESVQDHLVKVPVEDDAEIQPVAENYNGKWLITSHDDADGEPVFYFELFANNGEKLLSSEEYTTYIGAVNGIQTHKTNIEKGNFRISLTKRGDYIYKLLNGNGQLLCLGEHYKTKARCQSAVESVKRFAISSPVLTDSSLTK